MIAIKDLSTNEITYICSYISPKEIKKYFGKFPKDFARIKPGFRAAGLSDDEAINTVVKNVSSGFVENFVTKWLEQKIYEIDGNIKALMDSGLGEQRALIQTFPDSIFEKNIDLYFKVVQKDVSEQYIALIKEAIMMLSEISEIEKKVDESSSENYQKQIEQLIFDVEANNEDLVKANQVIDSLNNELNEQREHVGELEAEISNENDHLIAKNKHWEQFANCNDVGPVDEQTDYQHTSICRVINDLYDRPKLIRLADVSGDHIELFVSDETKPYRFDNRDRLFWNDGPSESDFIGIWNWSAIPNNNDPSTDYVKTAYTDRIGFVQILIMSEATSLKDVISAICKDVGTSILGNRVLCVYKTENGYYEGVLCNSKDFEEANGIIRLSKNICVLPTYLVNPSDVLAIHNFYLYRNLGMGIPQDTYYVKSPIDIVKECVLSYATSTALRNNGLSKKEAQHCQAFIKELPLHNLYEEISQMCLCTLSDAKKYVDEFIELADSYLSANDVELSVLALCLDRNIGFVNKCKDQLRAEWEDEIASIKAEEEKKISLLKQTREEMAVKISEFESTRSSKLKQLDDLDASISEKEALVQKVNENVANRIAEARKNAADFISEMAFCSANVDIPSRENSIVVEQHVTFDDCGSIGDINTFKDELSENFERIGYEEVIASEMADMFAFCSVSRLPIIIGSNAIEIANCVSATLRNRGVDLITAMPDLSNVVEICDYIEKDCSNYKIVLIDGVLDSLNSALFQRIENSFKNTPNAIVVMSLGNVPVDLLPSNIVERSIYIDGDIGLETYGSSMIKGFVCTFEFVDDLDSDAINERLRELKPFAKRVKRLALRNYSRYLASTGENLSTSSIVILQILISYIAAGKKEEFEELARECKFDNRVISKLGRLIEA